MVVRGQEPTAVLSFCATARALPGVQAIARDDCKRRSLERAVGQRPTRERAVAPSWWPSERGAFVRLAWLKAGPRFMEWALGGAAPKRLPNTIPAPLACVLGAFSVRGLAAVVSVMMARAADAARGVNDQISGLARQDRATQQRLSIPRVASGSKQRGSRALRLLRGAADGIPARQLAFPAVVGGALSRERARVRGRLRLLGDRGRRRGRARARGGGEAAARRELINALTPRERDSKKK